MIAQRRRPRSRRNAQPSHRRHAATPPPIRRRSSLDLARDDPEPAEGSSWAPALAHVVRLRSGQEGPAPHRPPFTTVSGWPGGRHLASRAGSRRTRESRARPRASRDRDGGSWRAIARASTAHGQRFAAGRRGRPRSLTLDSAEPVASADGIRVSQSASHSAPPGESEPAAPGWRIRPSALLACSLARASPDTRRLVRPVAGASTTAHRGAARLRPFGLRRVRRGRVEAESPAPQQPPRATPTAVHDRQRVARRATPGEPGGQPAHAGVTSEAEGLSRSRRRLLASPRPRVDGARPELARTPGRAPAWRPPGQDPNRAGRS